MTTHFVSPAAGFPAAPACPLPSGLSLPSGLRDAAAAMSWPAFAATYAPSGGPVRLAGWRCEDEGRPARLRPHALTFHATLAVGDRIESATARAGGPVAALTAMLYERGISLELRRFHQLPAGTHTATFVHGHDGRRTEWAMGWSGDTTQSALRAVIACANRLLTPAP